MLKQTHNSPEPGELVSTETLYRANGEVVELPLIEENPLGDRPQSFSGRRQLLAR